MKKFLIFSLMLPVITMAQGLKSPEEFLGYPLGKHFTPHHKISAYFEHVAASMPGMVQLKKYGKTYEGRPLLYAVVSSPENMANAEKIRNNQLRLAGMVAGEGLNANSPVVVWLSYNVHGNEASSSEVSMRMIYELLQPVNPKLKDWLKNTMVIIDPCLNPDGRDRYVNWFNQVVGKNANPSMDAREHHEPWPGGRSNHYYFDLNRDWAWQSQVETQQRIKVYNEWMPAIHVDFHEQYYNNPYYFAPAAEPFHEVITTFQRNFQHTIGMNHARYFDEKGWLYFTKEYFDLFYPAYGDTYPIYNGSIGMTYEQAGHSLAGTAIETGGDTLTLDQRIDHHFTTGMSTIEVAAANAEKINSEFSHYFSDGIKNGNGVYKTYVLSGENKGKIGALKLLFDRNQIRYSYAGKKTNIKGFNYFSGKEESYSSNENDLVISAYQPKAALVRVLFEPQSKLSDSSTYDITAWALPYAHGVQAYALKDRFMPADFKPGADISVTSSNAYAYLVNYNSLQDGKFLASMLLEGVRVRFSEVDFAFNGKTYSRGTLVILKNGNESKIPEIISLAAGHDVSLTAISSGFMEKGVDFGSDKIRMVKIPRVALVAGENVSENAVGEIWHLFDQELEYPITLVEATKLEELALKNYDVVIIPNGNFKSLSDKDGNDALKLWLRGGGKLIAMGNIVSQMSAGEWGIKMKKEDDSKDESAGTYQDLKKYGNRDREGIVDNIPGAIYKMELDNSHPMAFGYPSTYFSLKANSHLYEFMKDGWNVGVIKKDNQVSGFVGSRLQNKIKDGTTIAVQPYGQGSVIYFADNPLFRGFWENGKLMFTNAVFLVGQ